MKQRRNLQQLVHFFALVLADGRVGVSSGELESGGFGRLGRRSISLTVACQLVDTLAIHFLYDEHQLRAEGAFTIPKCFAASAVVVRLLKLLDDGPHIQVFHVDVHVFHAAVEATHRFEQRVLVDGPFELLTCHVL